MKDTDKKQYHQDKMYNTLIEEYKLLKQDAFIHINFTNQQFSIMHLFTLGILGVLSFISSNFAKATQNTLLGKATAVFDKSIIPNNEDFFMWFVILASIFIFYYLSLIMSSAMKFRFVRRRLGRIEDSINEIIGTDVMKYESKQAPRIYGKIAIDMTTITPTALSLILKVSLIFVYALLLLIISNIIGGKFFIFIFFAYLFLFAMLAKAVHGTLISEKFISDITNK